MLTLYGIRNCDSIKKAQKFLEERHIQYKFHDYKKEGANLEVLTTACAIFGWENLLNKRGTTWRRLDDATKNSVSDETHAIELMMRETSLIKRPLLLGGGLSLLGFDALKWDDALGQAAI